MGELSDTDPVAAGDPEIVSRLYLAETHSLLLTARWNGSTTTAPTQIDLPASVTHDPTQVYTHSAVACDEYLVCYDRLTCDYRDLQWSKQLWGVHHAVEIDAYSLQVSMPTVSMVASVGEARASSLVLPAGGGFSAVLLPKPNCPGLLMVKPAVVPTIAMSGDNSTTIALSVHAPWQNASQRLSTTVVVTVTGPGLNLSATTLTLPGTLTLRASAPSKTKAFYMLTIEGTGVLPTRRWVEAA